MQRESFKKFHKKLEELYEKKATVKRDYGYLFKEGLGSLKTRSIQYLNKSVASFRMADAVIALGKKKPDLGASAGRVE